MKTATFLEIYANQVQASNWKIGHTVEDTRQGSPTQGCQFEIIDYGKQVISLRELDQEEYLVPGELFSRIFR